MTQSNLLTLAKLGDAKAIADVISYLMQTEGVIAKAALKDGFLEIIVEANRVPTQQQSLTHIHKIINYLQPRFINKIGVYGKQTGTYSLDWYEEFKPFAANYKSLEPIIKAKTIDIKQA